MKRFKVRIVIDPHISPDEFEVPAEQPMRYLVDHLVTGLDLKRKERGKEINYWFEKAGKPIHPDLSLANAGITNNSLIILKSGAEQPFPPNTDDVDLKPLFGKESEKITTQKNKTDLLSNTSLPPDTNWQMRKLEDPKDIK